MATDDFIGVPYDSKAWWEKVENQREVARRLAEENPAPASVPSQPRQEIDPGEESARMDAYEKGFGW